MYKQYKKEKHEAALAIETIEALEYLNILEKDAARWGLGFDASIIRRALELKEGN